MTEPGKAPRRPRASHAQARKEAREAGFLPAGVYPSAVNRPWPLRCSTCDQVHEDMSLGKVRRGVRCAHDRPKPPVTPPPPRVLVPLAALRPPPSQAEEVPAPAALPSMPDMAVEMLAAAGYVPVDPYPGFHTLPWMVECVECHLHTPVRLDRVTPCTHPVPRAPMPPRWNPKGMMGAHEAVQYLRLGGYIPVDEYPGKQREPWRVKCQECGKERKVRLWHLRERPADFRCRHGRRR